MRLAMSVVIFWVLTATFTPLAIAQQPRSFVRVVGFPVDSSWLVTGSRLRIDFSPDGEYFTLGGGVFRSSPPVQLGPVFRDRGFDSGVAALHPDGKQVFVCGQPLSVWAMDGKIPDRGQVQPYGLPGSKPPSNPSFRNADLPKELVPLENPVLAFDREGKHLFSMRNSLVEKRSFPDGKLMSKIQTEMEFDQLLPLAQGQLLLWKRGQNSLRFWDGHSIRTESLRDQVNGTFASAPAISPDRRVGLQLLNYNGGNANGSMDLLVINLVERRIVSRVPNFAVRLSGGIVAKATAICFLPDGKSYAVGYENGRIEIRNDRHQIMEAPSVGMDRVTIATIVKCIGVDPQDRFLAVFQGALSLYERGGKPVSVKSDLDEFPYRPGAQWLYRCVRDGSPFELTLTAGPPEMAGSETCFRLFFMETKMVNQKVDIYNPDSMLLSFRPEGLMEVAEGDWTGGRTDAHRWYEVPFPLLPREIQERSQSLKGRVGASGERQIEWTSHEDRVDLPTQKGARAIRVLRTISTGSTVSKTESIWFVKEIGIVRREIVENSRVTHWELVRYQFPK